MIISLKMVHFNPSTSKVDAIVFHLTSCTLMVHMWESDLNKLLKAYGLCCPLLDSSTGSTGQIKESWYATTSQRFSLAKFEFTP